MFTNFCSDLLPCTCLQSKCVGFTRFYDAWLKVSTAREVLAPERGGIGMISSRSVRNRVVRFGIMLFAQQPSFESWTGGCNVQRRIRYSCSTGWLQNDRVAHIASLCFGTSALNYKLFCAVAFCACCFFRKRSQGARSFVEAEESQPFQEPSLM